MKRTLLSLILASFSAEQVEIERSAELVEAKAYLAQN